MKHSAADFPTSLTALLEEEERTSEHPGPEELLAFRGSELPPEDRERLRDHLTACRGCMALLDDLDAFEEAAAEQAEEAPADFETAAFWRILRPRISHLRRSVPLAWAASLGVAALGLGMWGALRSSQLAELESDVEALSRLRANPAVVDLYSDTSDRDAASRPQRVGMTRAGLVLLLTPEPAREYDDYLLRVVDADGRETWRADGLELDAFDGTLSLLVPAGGLAAGDYRLELSGRDGERFEPLETYVFQLVDDADPSPP